MADVKRCVSCGAQNPVTAEWCTLCLTRFDGSLPPSSPPPVAEAEITDELSALGRADALQEPEEPQTAEPEKPEPETLPPAPLLTPPPPVSNVPVRFLRDGERVRWVCPTCATLNDVERSACRICGTMMARLFAPPQQKKVSGRRPATATLVLSAVLPGLGHVAEGEGAAGAARAVLYLWTLAIGLLLVLRPPAKGRPVVRAVGIVFTVAAGVVWLIAIVESLRLMKGDRRPLVPPKTMTWVTAGLTLALFAGIAASLLGKT